MELDAILRANEFVRVERPPSLWEADTDEVGVIRLIGEMIAAGLGRGNDLGDLVLNASNVTIEPGSEPTGVAAGDYVALSVRGGGDWGPEWTWRPGETTSNKVFCHVEAEATGARAVWAYSRTLEGEGSVTVFIRRLQSSVPQN
jgi:hypothetical protein